MQRIKETILCWGLVLVIIATIIIPLGKAIFSAEKNMVVSQEPEIKTLLAELEKLN